MTESEIHISQASVLHSETTYVREYAASAKRLLTLHLSKQNKKDEKNYSIMKQATHALKHSIQKSSLLADAVGAVVSKKERHTLKQHLIQATIKNKGGGKLLNEHMNRRQRVLAEIYDRKVQRRKVLDDSFSFGSSILHKMTNVLNTCTCTCGVIVWSVNGACVGWLLLLFVGCSS